MKIVTIDRRRLNELSRELYLRATRGGERHDCVVGIASGGAIVARAMEVEPTFEVECRRPSSTRKGSYRLRNLLKRLPRLLTDCLRIAEHRWLTAHKAAGRRDVSLTPELKAFLNTHPAARILVVDDAVDSGLTLKSVVEALRAEAPAAAIISAAVTVTTPHPAADADVAIFRDGTLCRFPWSADYNLDDGI